MKKILVVIALILAIGYFQERTKVAKMEEEKKEYEMRKGLVKRQLDFYRECSRFENNYAVFEISGKKYVIVNILPGAQSLAMARFSNKIKNYKKVTMVFNHLDFKNEEQIEPIVKHRFSYLFEVPKGMKDKPFIFNGYHEVIGWDKKKYTAIDDLFLFNRPVEGPMIGFNADGSITVNSEEQKKELEEKFKKEGKKVTIHVKLQKLLIMYNKLFFENMG